MPTGKYRNESPHYSMLGRNVMPGDSTNKPGPGAHQPEMVTSESKNKKNDLLKTKILKYCIFCLKGQS